MDDTVSNKKSSHSPRGKTGQSMGQSGKRLNTSSHRHGQHEEKIKGHIKADKAKRNGAGDSQHIQHHSKRSSEVEKQSRRAASDSTTSICSSDEDSLPRSTSQRYQSGGNVTKNSNNTKKNTEQKAMQRTNWNNRTFTGSDHDSSIGSVEIMDLADDCDDDMSHAFSSQVLSRNSGNYSLNNLNASPARSSKLASNDSAIRSANHSMPHLDHCSPPKFSKSKSAQIHTDAPVPMPKRSLSAGNLDDDDDDDNDDEDDDDIGVLSPPQSYHRAGSSRRRDKFTSSSSHTATSSKHDSSARSYGSKSNSRRRLGTDHGKNSKRSLNKPSSERRINGQRPLNVIIIAGASGMGKALATKVVRSGGTVLIAAKDTSELQRVSKEVRQQQGSVRSIMTASLDASNEMQIKLFAKDISSGKYGRLKAGDWDGLAVVNGSATTAAGMAATQGSLFDMPTSEARSRFETNFWTAYNCVKYLCPLLRSPGGGVVLTTGMLSRRPNIFNAPIAAANGALEGLTKSLSLELGPIKGIRVNCLSPGFCEGEDDKNFEKGILRRAGQPEDLGEALYYLLTAPFTTGTILHCDGGYGI